MNTQWHDFLAAVGAQFAADARDISHFGNAAGELQATASGTVLVPLTHLGLIDAAGEEAKSFLHNQLTSDINHLAEGQAQHSAWCTAKGRMLASFVIWRRDGAYRLALAAELEEAILKRLQMYVLRAKVKNSDVSADYALVGVAGPQAEAALAAADLAVPAEAMTTARTADVIVIRLDAQRFVLEVPAASTADLWKQLAGQATPAGTDAWRWLDVQAALPVVTGPTKEEFVPQMADFEKIGGVSFHKGCYPGQEIVARTQYLGKVKRHLYRLTSTQSTAAGADLFSPGNPDQACGKVVSAAPSPTGGYVGLAVIQANFADDVRLESREGPAIQVSAVHP